jgi:2-amino-4-hydroxy-6-hydroxymethyldihydropteridine diphosphokinase
LNASANLEDGSAVQPVLHQVCLNLGSNIAPEIHIPRAVALLRRATQLEAVSQCWETPAVGSSGPNFINLAVRLLTPLDAAALKREVIGGIETALGRIRSADKYADRTIDLDIILFDGAVIEPDLWSSLFLALPISELFPTLMQPGSGRTLQQVAHDLRRDGMATLRAEILKSDV